MLLSWSVGLLEFAQCDSNRQDRPEDSPGSKSQLSEKSPLEPLDDEVEEAPLTPLDREVPSKPAEPLPSEDLGIAQSEPLSESLFLFLFFQQGESFLFFNFVFVLPILVFVFFS